MRCIRITREPCPIDMDYKTRNSRFEDCPLHAHYKLLHGSVSAIRRGHFEGSDFRCHTGPTPHRHGYVLFRWGLSQLVQNDSLRRRKVLSASLVSGPRDDNPTRLVGQIIENAFEMEQVALLNGTLPISRLDNYFVLDSTLLKLPIHINLMR